MRRALRRAPAVSEMSGGARVSDGEAMPERESRELPPGAGRRRRALPAAAALLIYCVAGVLLLHPVILGDRVLWAGADVVRGGPFPDAIRSQGSPGIGCLSPRRRADRQR